MTPPAPTLYVKNIEQNAASHRQLRRLLYHLFSKHGEVIDVVVLSRKAMRGRAWIVFANIDDAVAAKAALQDSAFLSERKLVIDFAEKKSEATAIRDGTWIHRERRGENCGADGKAPSIN